MDQQTFLAQTAAALSKNRGSLDVRADLFDPEDFGHLIAGQALGLFTVTPSVGPDNAAKLSPRPLYLTLTLNPHS